MKHHFLILTLFVCALYTTIIHSQNVLGPDTAVYKRYIHKYEGYSPQSSGYLYNFNVMPLGNDGSSSLYRAFYQWNIPDNIIPDNAQIDTVILFFTYTPLVSNYYLPVKYFDVGGDLQNPDADNMWQRSNSGSNYEIGSGWGNKYGYQGTSLDTVISVFVYGSDFCDAIKNSLSEDKFILGITSQSESYTREWNIDNFSVTLFIKYSGQEHFVVIDQKLSTNTSVDSIGLWNSSNNRFTNFSVPDTFKWETNSVQTLRGSQKVISNQKYKFWEINSEAQNNVINHKSIQITPSTTDLTSRFDSSITSVTIKNSLEGTSLTGGKIKFADPWYIDFADPDYENQLRNRGMKDYGADALQYRERTSPFNPDNSIIYQNGNDPAHAYQGVFLNQPYSGDNPVYYSVQALNLQQINFTGTGNTRNFYFQKWGGEGASYQNSFSATTGVVFTSEDAVVNANFKGHLLSNSEQALNDGPQRRLVRTDNGIYHLVYESMGWLWYTYSLTADFNGDWSDEQPFGEGKNPSMDYEGNEVKVVYEMPKPDFPNEELIELVTMTPDGNDHYTFTEVEDIATCSITYYGNAKPVIAYNYGKIFVAYRKNNTGGIYQKTKYLNGNNWQWTDETFIPNTNSNSINPSVTGVYDYLFLVYQHSNTINFMYGYWQSPLQNWSFPSQYYATISAGSGFRNNYLPSISRTNYYTLIVSWIVNYGDIPGGGGGTNKSPSIDGAELADPQVVTRVGSSGGSHWGSFYKAGDNVTSAVNNSLADPPNEASIIAWSEESGTSYSSKWIRRTSSGYTDAQSLSTNGKQIQVSNGADLDNIGACVLSTSTIPYDMVLTTTPFDQTIPGGETKKVKNNIDLAYGREGVISKNGIEFLFDIGDVIVDDSVIKFIDCPDTVAYNSQTELNELVRTESFSLTPESEFYFTDFYYVLYQEEADSLLTENDIVNFKAELVNYLTGDVYGTFDNITYSREQLERYENISYQVDCSNLTPGDYFLRLKTSVQGDAQFFLVNVQNSSEDLNKKEYNRINFDGSKLPSTYDMSQNFPNPFNPATKINYQIPQKGFVTLKIYDILGNEVATVVNEQKNKGRYSVSFNASDLASGVYIYQLRVNDYVASKKMLLIK